MKPLIKFFLDDETLTYFIKQSYGKVLFQNDQNVFFFQAESNDDLDHVEGDSLQNAYPEVVLSIEDFPVDCDSLEGLLPLELSIPVSEGTFTNKDGETSDVYYTNLNLNNEDDLGTNENTLRFELDENGEVILRWKGVCEHFENEDEMISFEVISNINFKEPERDFEDAI